MSINIRKYIITASVLLLFGQLVVSQTPPPSEQKTTVSGDSLLPEDSSVATPKVDSMVVDSAPRPKKNFLEDPMSGTNEDSLVYDLRQKMVYIYRKGDVTYQTMNLKADYIRINLSNKEIYAFGIKDSLDKQTRPEFIEGGSTYTMDTITYNISSKKAMIKGVASQEGEGYLISQKVKKMPDNSINFADGIYTTCDHEHPHFGLCITKGRKADNKVIFGPSYLVMEDVPIYFLGLPFGFFPSMSGRSSGFIIPEYGEENIKGFFLRNGGYYYVFNDYLDATVTGGFYTLGSWEAAVSSQYLKKYKYRGNFSTRFSKDIIGEKGAADYVDMSNFNLNWSHSQDPKFRPNSTFSASVNFASSGYSKHSSTNMNDYLNTQTNSSVSYSKTWAGKPYSFSTNIQHSQNSRDTTISLSFPNVVFNVARIFPFKRKEAVGKEQWYEKISLSYTGTMANNVTVKERELMTDKMFREMKNGVNHTIPISTSWNILKYITFSPSANYNERWYFKKVDKAWDPVNNQLVPTDTTYGFYRVYNYSFSASAQTKFFGMYQFKNKKSPVQAVRHTVSPNIGMSFTPDFSQAKYGYYKTVQSDASGKTAIYSPYESGMYGVPGRGKSASINFGLQNTLEMKVLSKKDTTGMKKIKLIDNLSATGSYNLLADSMNLSMISLSLRTTISGNFGLNITAMLDPYEVDPVTGTRINRYMIKRGKPGRIASTGWSFGYTFNSKKSDKPAMNDINSQGGMVDNPQTTDFFNNPENLKMDPNTQRMMMTSQYYEFDIPWNLGFNYTLGYTNNGLRKDVVMTLGFNGSVNLTPKWGMTFNGGYDFESKKLTPGVVNITRDLHCWQMNLSWVPVGYRKSWSFNISVKSSILQDLKYDKRSSYYDNLYD